MLRQDSVRPKFGSVDDQATIIGAMAMNQFRDSFVGYRQYWVLAQRAALLCRCASATGLGRQSIHRILLRYEFAPCFQPQTEHPGGLIEVPSPLAAG